MKALFFRWPVAMVIVILGFQVSLSLPRINEPILDGRVHWYFDNALFLLRAKHSNFHPPQGSVGNENPVLKIFGTATYGYDDHGRASRLNLYSHHPILSPTLFRLYARIFGYGNWVPRSFALLLSLATTFILFLLLKAVLKDDLLSGLLTLLYTMLPLNLMFMDQWKYEITTNLLFLSCFYFLGEIQNSRIYRPAFLCSVFLLFQVEWISYFAVPCLLFYLHLKRKDPAYKGLFSRMTVVSILAVLMNFAILYQLGFDFEEMKSAGGSRMMEAMATVGTKNWFFTQVYYLKKNFGETNLALFLMGMTYLCLRRSRKTNILVFGSLILTFSTICYVGIFQNLSLIHHFLQWSLGPAYVLLLGGILAGVPRVSLKTGNARGLTLAVVLPLLFLTALGGYNLNQSIRASVFGSPSDLEAIKTFQKRLIVFSDGRSGPIGWWFNPVIALARDPISRGTEGEGSVKAVDEISAVDSDRDIVVVLNSKGALNSFRKDLGEKFGIRKVELMGRSRSFSFFRIIDIR